jgi:glutathione synthase/RimK-type ligase-like ATP-grasp enzyme
MSEQTPSAENAPAAQDTPVSYVNTRCVRAACDRLGIPYSTHDPYGNFVSVNLDQQHFFVNASAPFNTSSVDKICKDKDFTSKLLSDAVRMPKSHGYFDPYPIDEQYAGYVTEGNYDSIAADVAERFGFPVIIKMNAGQKGNNIFLCKDQAEARVAFAKIFDHSSPSHDYVALAQEYIAPKKEYRVIVFKGEIVLTYEKDISDAKFVGNLSPLHYENAKAILIPDQELLARLQSCIDPLFPKLDLEFGGVDIIENDAGEHYVIELNTHPGFSYFVRHNGEEALVQMYEQILKSLRA